MSTAPLLNDPTDLATRLSTYPEMSTVIFRDLIENDHGMSKDYDLFLSISMPEVIDSLLAVSDTDMLINFWNQIPSVLEIPVLDAIERFIENANNLGDISLSRKLRQRLDDICALREEIEKKLDDLASASVNNLRLLLEHLKQTTLDELPIIWEEIDLEWEEVFFDMVEAQIETAKHGGAMEIADHLRQCTLELRRIQVSEDRPSYLLALHAFVTAEDEENACQVFLEHQPLLEPYEVLQALERWKKEVEEATLEQAENRSLVGDVTLQFLQRSNLLAQLRGLSVPQIRIIQFKPKHQAEDSNKKRKFSLNEAAARHAVFYHQTIILTNKSQDFSQVPVDYQQIQHAWKWAIYNNLDLALSIIDESFHAQNVFGLVQDNLKWCEQALKTIELRGDLKDIAYVQTSMAMSLTQIANTSLEGRRDFLLKALELLDSALAFYRLEELPDDYAQVERIRAVALSDMATLPGEDQRSLMLAALDCIDNALQFDPAITPASAIHLNTRALTLQELALVDGEDKYARLWQALSTLNDAVTLLNPNKEPIDYANTQNSRALILDDIAQGSGASSHMYLMDALTALEEGLRFCTSANSPQGYAMLHHNRAHILQRLASIEKENRRIYLLEALDGLDNALRFRTLDLWPLEHAQSLNNRSTVLGDLATLEGDAAKAMLYQALEAAYRAVTIFDKLQHYPSVQAVRQTLCDLQVACGEDFLSLWSELDVGLPPDWLILQ